MGLSLLAAGLWHAGSKLAADKLTPKMPKAPQVPQVDTAQQMIQETDRLKRRKGVMANIYAGNAAAPTTGKQTLGG